MNGLGGTRGVQNAEKLFEVVLHEAVKEDLVLVTEGSGLSEAPSPSPLYSRKKRVLEDDSRLLEQLVVGAQRLLLQGMGVIGQVTFETEHLEGS